MDARALDFPDNTFDGVYSSGSIEHFGSLENVANAAFEIGRVLRPGGVATIATEFKVGGPPELDGWDPNVILFSPEKLRKWIIDASGLELVDPLNLEISDGTLSVRRDLLGFLEGTRGPISAAKKIAHYPNLILYHEGYLFCSVHLALRKPEDYPAVDNHWAAPCDKTRELVRRLRAETGGQLGGTLLDLLPHKWQEPEEAVGLRDRITVLSNEWEGHVAEIAQLRDRIAVLSNEWEGHVAEIVQLRDRIAGLDVASRAWETAYREIKASMSWRITAPLRKAFDVLSPGRSKNDA
jgi:hypothetical protein